MLHRLALSPVLVLALTPALPAQLDVRWVEFQSDPSRLALTSDPTAGDTEVDFASGDLDHDGDVDVVVVRKQRWSMPGKRTNLLLIDVDGVLTDRTAQYASSSDVPLDQGFLTATCDRDVVVADVDVDGWLDVVTATAQSDGDPKHLSHPRVYRNKGAAGGSWGGLRHEDARIPPFVSLTGLAAAPRFSDVAAGDVDGDGAPELHFVDSDFGVPAEPAGHDLDDRLLRNDGFGYFTDVTASSLTAAQAKSTFGLGTLLVDVNGDGRNDVVRVNALGTPQDCHVYHNEPLGSFQALGATSSGGQQTYGMDVADLNQDGRLDIVLQDDHLDRYRFNLGNDASGRVVWSPLQNFSFVSGHDDGFGHKVHLEDLDGDGFVDALICDYDVEIPGCTGRRMHVYHNLGGAPGAAVVLREESELASGDKGAGWKGVPGMSVPDLRGTMDLAFGDFDEDSDPDFLQARCDGFYFWSNRTVVCADLLGGSSPGGPSLVACGSPLTEPGSQAVLALAGAAPLAPVWLVAGLATTPFPLAGGMLVPTPTLVVSGLVTDSTGRLNVVVPGGGGPAFHVYVQAVVGGTLALSNAIDLELGS